jgi:catechol 2,3-dioxygenase-like lactoylglutathione lyase family enzyme
LIELAKPAVDVGLFTRNREDLLTFWQARVGVPFTELLPLGGGLQQHRHAIGDSVLKINHSRDPLPRAPASGIRRLTIRRGDIDEPILLTDPDGNEVLLTPENEVVDRKVVDLKVEQIRVDLTVSHLDSHLDFYGGALGLPALDGCTFRCGVSQIRLTEGEATREPEQRAVGYRYLTLQVFDVLGCHSRIIAKGGREGREPMKLGDVAHISFVRDPDGNWIEISQRRSITGSLD